MVGWWGLGWRAIWAATSSVTHAYPHISYITAMRAQVGVSGSDVPPGPSFVNLS